MDRRIVIFNHKGGVSKTTTTYHLGWKLAEKGKKVLLVDADTQCNLTGLILKDKFDEYYTNIETKYNNLKDGVSPAFKASPEPIEAVECYQIERNPNLYLLPGHPNLSEIEPSLSFAQTAGNTFSVLQNLPGAFNALIEKIVEKYGIDIVFFDLNPSMSAINQNLFSISDLFIIPTNPDPFSFMAVKTLSEIIPEWMKRKQQLHDIFKNVSYNFPLRKTLFGGIITQKFNIRNGQPVKPYRDNLDEIKKAVKEILYPNLKKYDLTFEEQKYDDAGLDDNFVIAEIPDFQTLGQQATKFGIPVFALSDTEIEKQGIVLDQQKEKRAYFNQIFDELAEKVIKLLNYA